MGYPNLPQYRLELEVVSPWVRPKALVEDQLDSRYLEFEVKHGHYLARRNKAGEKNEEIKA
ncbi:hypothetical protein H5410_004054 [Solanum commersonii]|uniref:Uncharacterized protein n=1 Tax=Solanum commersonii TaxID=4109 RepID=A0A9J6B6N9_SOLCO|nr:hypothetical protein H5410_004054 [Solanum commersonii]